MSKFEVKGKHIMVTGGAQGIGRCVVNILADVL
jgi:NAD(P)-dependent dehydrogenase (short-subunit alcohol dehydrogenase family)